MIEAGQLSLDDFVQKQTDWLSKLIEKSKGASLNFQAESGPPCPLCGEATQKRRSKNGAFWGCGRYPDCSGIVAIEQTSAKTGAKAKFQSPTRTRKSATGRKKKPSTSLFNIRK